MPDYLPISRAARTAGVSRKRLQEKITAGELTSFEGMVPMADLFAVFPNARAAESPQNRRVREIKENAIHKAHPDDSPSEFALLRQRVEHLEHMVNKTRTESEHYKDTISILAAKLEDMQENCDQRQKAMLGTLITWMMHRMGERNAGS